MSAQVKKAGRIGTKIVAAFLFLLLLMFNVEVGLYDGEAQESGILGMTLNVVVQNAFAGAGSEPQDCGAGCGHSCKISVPCSSHPAHYVECSGHSCSIGVAEVTCDGHTTSCW